MDQQLFLEIMEAILAATIGMENAAGRRFTQPHRHIQGTDGQILFHPVAYGPPDHTTTEQIDNGSQELELSWSLSPLTRALAN
ncbi:hypothetical protein JCM25156A_21810 [Komagataeibacter kakiaceti JCM 25156]